MMKTRWENWKATVGQLSAEYRAEREWAEDEGVRLSFNLCIDFKGNDCFYVKVTNWVGDDFAGPKMFGRFDEAIEYLYDVDCEKFVDEQYAEFQKMI